MKSLEDKSMISAINVVEVESGIESSIENMRAALDKDNDIDPAALQD